MEEKGRGGVEGSLLLPADLAAPLLPSPVVPGPEQSFPGQLHHHQARLLLLSDSPKKGSIPDQRGREPVWSSSRNQRDALSSHSFWGSQRMGGGLELSPFTHGYDSTSSQASRCPPPITGPTIPALCSSSQQLCGDLGSSLACESTLVSRVHSRRCITHRPCTKPGSFLLLLGQLVLWPSLG